MAKEKAEGKPSHFENENSATGWGRGTKIAEASAAAAEFDNKMRERNERKKPEDNNNFIKGEQVNKIEPKEDRPPRKQRVDDAPFTMSRSTMGNVVKDAPKEENKAPEKKSGPPVFTRSKAKTEGADEK